MHSPAHVRIVVRQHVFPDFLDLGFGRLFRKFDDLGLDALEHLVVHAFVIVHAELTGLDHAVAQHDDGVARAPHAFFFLGAIGVGVGHGMAAIAIGQQFKEIWAFAAAHVIHRNLRGGVVFFVVLVFVLFGWVVVVVFVFVLFCFFFFFVV